MALRYLSLCSGIEAATVAWEPLGWLPAAFAEIEKFPSAVLAHHYPSVPNLGDITKISGKDFRGKIDLIVGGPPCQSYSVAGSRKGLDDPRGQISLVFLSIVGKAQPRWVIVENVPGLLGTDQGRAFGTILGTLAKFGYGFAWRVLDAQHFGVPQRRRRLYLIGHLGNWRPAAAVLFERHCLSGHTPPRRKTGEEVAGTLTSRSRSGGWSQDVDMAAGGYMQVSPSVTSGAPFSRTGNARVETEALVAHTLRGEGFDASEDGTGRQNLIPVAFSQNQLGEVRLGNVAGTLNQNSNASGRNTPMLFEPGLYTAVRRLMPLECERLQGFPDHYTLIPWRGKPAALCPDGPRYKALGNSMAVPVMRWIGERIIFVENLMAAQVI